MCVVATLLMNATIKILSLNDNKCEHPTLYIILHYAPFSTHYPTYILALYININAYDVLCDMMLW